jgi:alkylation response protein AidB-like acyl-CoA dehydrogenase
MQVHGTSCRKPDSAEANDRAKTFGTPHACLETTQMDLNFTAEELAFRQEIRGWVAENLPQDISHKVLNALRLSRDDMQRWAKILGKKGWLGYGWPKQFGGPGWNAVQKHLFEEECALAGAPRIVPFGPVMVAPVIMHFGNAEQHKRFLPGIASGEVWWSQGYSEPGSGSDLASVKTRAERISTSQGDKYIVNGQKTWTTLGQYGEWIFCLVRTGTEGKPQAGISFLLIDMKSPGITVRPIITLDGEHEVNEVFFDNVEVPAENLIGEENKGWTYAKHLLAHERTNIADVNRAKRELERLKRIAKAEGVYEDGRFRDQIALLEVDIVALEMMVLRVLSAEKSGKASLDIAGLLKIRGSEIQQRYTELMMLAAGPFSAPYVHEAMEAGWQGDFAGAAACAPLAGTYFNYRKTTIYGGSNEVQRNIVAQTVLGS